MKGLLPLPGYLSAIFLLAACHNEAFPYPSDSSSRSVATSPRELGQASLQRKSDSEDEAGSPAKGPSGDNFGHRHTAQCHHGESRPHVVQSGTGNIQVIHTPHLLYIHNTNPHQALYKVPKLPQYLPIPEVYPPVHIKQDTSKSKHKIPESSNKERAAPTHSQLHSQLAPLYNNFKFALLNALLSAIYDTPPNHYHPAYSRESTHDSDSGYRFSDHPSNTQHNKEATHKIHSDTSSYESPAYPPITENPYIATDYVSATSLHSTTKDTVLVNPDSLETNSQTNGSTAASVTHSSLTENTSGKISDTLAKYVTQTSMEYTENNQKPSSVLKCATTVDLHTTTDSSRATVSDNTRSETLTESSTPLPVEHTTIKRDALVSDNSTTPTVSFESAQVGTTAIPEVMTHCTSTATPLCDERKTTDKLTTPSPTTYGTLEYTATTIPHSTTLSSSDTYGKTTANESETRNKNPTTLADTVTNPVSSTTEAPDLTTAACTVSVTSNLFLTTSEQLTTIRDSNFGETSDATKAEDHTSTAEMKKYCTHGTDTTVTTTMDPLQVTSSIADPTTPHCNKNNIPVTYHTDYESATEKITQTPNSTENEPLSTTESTIDSTVTPCMTTQSDDITTAPTTPPPGRTTSFVHLKHYDSTEVPSSMNTASTITTVHHKTEKTSRTESDFETNALMDDITTKPAVQTTLSTDPENNKYPIVTNTPITTDNSCNTTDQTIYSTLATTIPTTKSEALPSLTTKVYKTTSKVNHTTTTETTTLRTDPEPYATLTTIDNFTVPRTQTAETAEPTSITQKDAAAGYPTPQVEGLVMEHTTRSTTLDHHCVTKHPFTTTKTPQTAKVSSSLEHSEFVAQQAASDAKRPSPHHGMHRVNHHLYNPDGVQHGWDFQYEKSRPVHSFSSRGAHGSTFPVTHEKPIPWFPSLPIDASWDPRFRPYSQSIHYFANPPVRNNYYSHSADPWNQQYFYPAYSNPRFNLNPRSVGLFTRHTEYDR